MKLPAAPESINAEHLCQPLPQKKCIIVENPAEGRRSVISLVSSLDEKSLFPQVQGNEFENSPVHHNTDIAVPAYVCSVQIVTSDFFPKLHGFLCGKRLDSRYWTDVALGCDFFLVVSRTSCP